MCLFGFFGFFFGGGGATSLPPPSESASERCTKLLLPTCKNKLRVDYVDIQYIIVGLFIIIGSFCENFLYVFLNDLCSQDLEI